MAEARTDWRRVAILVGAGVVAAAQIGKVPPALPALRDGLGLSLIGASWVLSAFTLLGLATGMAAGAVAGALGNRRAATAGLALLAAASAAGGLAPGAAALLAARFVEGIGFMLVVVAIPALLADAAATDRRKLAFGFWGAYNPAGTALMTLAAPAALAAAGWRGLWLLNALLLAAYAVALLAVPRGAPAPLVPKALLADARATLSRPGPVLLALTFAAYTFLYLGMVGLLPTLFVAQDVDAGAAARLTALVMAVNVLGNLGAGLALDCGVRRIALVLVALAAMAGTSVAIYGAADFTTRYAACLAFSAVCGMLPATILGAAATLAPGPRTIPLVNGLVVQGSNLGQTLGPPAVAALATAAGGWHLTPLLFAGVAASGMAAALALRRADPRF